MCKVQLENVDCMKLKHLAYYPPAAVAARWQMQRAARGFQPAEPGD